MTAFIRPEQIRFKHCDAAGIVFYPRYFEMANDLVEDWFEELGFSFARLHSQEFGTGVPVCKVETNFKKPGYLGEVINKELRVTRIGTSSVHLNIIFRETEGDCDIKLLMEKVLVSVNLTSKRPEAWNPTCKKRMYFYFPTHEREAI